MKVSSLGNVFDGNQRKKTSPGARQTTSYTLETYKSRYTLFVPGTKGGKE